MKVIALTLTILVFTFTLCWAQKTPVEKAYNLYFQGKMKEAINVMEEYVQEKPEPKLYYFIGYAYYELKQMDIAREYFDKAYRLESFYVPPVKK